jgi:hypothetical protein
VADRLYGSIRFPQFHEGSDVFEASTTVAEKLGGDERTSDEIDLLMPRKCPVVSRREAKSSDAC